MGGREAELAAARLVAAHRCPYLASAVFAMTPRWRSGLGTFATDARWRVYVDPACFERWTVDEAAAVLIHEVHHLLRDHCGRAEAIGVTVLEHRRFNIAADLEINDDLGDLALPAGGVKPAQFGFDTGELAEAYFDWLEPQDLDEVGWECGSGAHGVPDEWEEPGRDGVGSGEADLIRQQAAAEIRSFHRQRGSVPAGLVRWADAYLEPTVDWRRLLAAAVRTAFANLAGSADFSYARPSRRSSPTRPSAILPSLRQPVPRVAVVVDTSGSMSRDYLDMALVEVRSVLQLAGVAGQYLTVFACDTTVHATSRVFAIREVQLIGGGGTDMRVGLEAALASRPRPDVVIVLTDGFTPWPSTPTPGRVIVGLIGDGGSSPSWAHEVRIPMPTSNAPGQ